jgi:hypothetical protein
MSISIFGFTQGLKKTVPVNLTDNTVTTIIDSDPTTTPPINANGFDLVGVRVVNKHSSAVTISLDMFDGILLLHLRFGAIRWSFPSALSVGSSSGRQAVMRQGC